MISFLLNHVRDKQPVRVYPKLRVAREVIHRNCQRVIDFWANMNWSVPSNHILTSMLHLLHCESEDPISLYYNVREMCDGVSMSRGFASVVGYGRVQPWSYFYGKDCDEIYIEHVFDDAMDQITFKHYTEWEAVRVIDHPFTALDYQLADGKVRSSGEKGRCIITVDLGLLYTQFKMWRMDADRCRYVDGTSKTDGNFIHSYVLPNMLKSHLDICWLNRIINTSQGKPNSFNKENSRMVLPTSYTNLDDIEENIVEHILNSREDYHTWVCQIPGLFKENMKAIIESDNVYLSEQIKTPLLLAQFKYVGWLVQMAMLSNRGTGTGSDTRYNNEIIKRLKELRNRHELTRIRGLDVKAVEKEISDKIESFLP